MESSWGRWSPLSIPPRAGRGHHGSRGLVRFEQYLFLCSDPNLAGVGSPGCLSAIPFLPVTIQQWSGIKGRAAAAEQQAAASKGLCVSRVLCEHGLINQVN